jgi:hypothetical protein
VTDMAAFDPDHRSRRDAPPTGDQPPDSTVDLAPPSRREAGRRAGALTLAVIVVIVVAVLIVVL